MKAPSTYYLKESKKYLVCLEVIHVWKDGMPSDVIDRVRMYDVHDGHVVDMAISLFHSMVSEGKLKHVTDRK